ncbi:MAG TPA: T9SS type A sorting domain-containing protein [Bacteroidaceae bacterium]|nr:T9SS type A sorting domain-containing protein [Bacteroidaceae bacterium]
MKTHLLKKNFTGLVMALLIIVPLLNLYSQVPGNVLSGSSMELADEPAWTVDIRHRDDLGDIPEYEFGSDKGCTECVGNGLNVWAAGAGYTNIIFYQEVTLKANSIYKANAAYKSLDEMAQNNWVQLKLGLTEYPKHENDGIKLMGTNAWLGCGAIGDGMLSDIACDWATELAGGIGWLAPDTMGNEFTAWFAIVMGMWTNEETGAYPYEYIIDEVVLVDSLEAASASVEPREVNNSASLLNYPNPFTEQTTLIYDIPARAQVRLTVYNLMGQEVATLYEGIREAGTHRTELNASAFNNNVLICKLEYDNQVIVRKLTMLK